MKEPNVQSVMEEREQMNILMRDLIEFIHFTQEVSTKIHGVLDEAEICRAVKEEFAKSKRYDAGIFLLTDGGSNLRVVETSESHRLRMVEKATGLQLKRFMIDLNKSSIFSKVVREGKTLRVNASDLVAELFPRSLAYLVSKTMGYKKKNTILTPLYLHGKVIGALALDSAKLAEYFIPSAKQLATHISTALEIAEEYADRQKMEEALRESEERYRSLFELAPDPILIVDMKGVVTSVNSAVLRLYGYSEDDIVGKHISKIAAIRARDIPKYLRMLSSALRGKPAEPFEVSYRCKDGSNVWAEAHSASIEIGDKRVGWQTILRDITERKKAEGRLKLFSDAVAGAIDGIAIVDMNGVITYTNSAMEKIYRYEKGELVGKPVSALNPHPKMAKQMISTLMETGSWTGEVLQQKKNKETFPALLSLSTVRDEKGKTIAMMGAVRDITKQKRAEARLGQTMMELARSNVELEQFAYVASHDLQEPLRMVASYVQLLARRYRGKLDADADEFIDYAVNGANYMQSMVNDMLAYSRVGTQGKSFKPTDCTAVLDQALANLQAAIEESRAAITHNGLPTVKADASQLVQLFQNLIDNAIKFRGEEPPQVHITAEQKKNRWVFSVRDNGIGIAPEYFERIFVPFKRLHSRAKYPGTGIGLAVCKKIVERHNGRIWVESQPGRGSVFYFTIPADKEVNNDEDSNDR